VENVGIGQTAWDSFQLYKCWIQGEKPIVIYCWPEFICGIFVWIELKYMCYF